MAREHVCPYNHDCYCDNPECYKCGWNPKVAERRQKRYEESGDALNKKFKIPFTGYYEVYAHSKEEAMEKALRDDVDYTDYNLGDPICLDKEEEDELD